MARVTAVTTVFPDTGLLRFFLSPKTQIMSSNKLCFCLTMEECRQHLLFLPCGRSSPGGGGGGGFQGGHVKADVLLAAVRTLCRNAPSRVDRAATDTRNVSALRILGWPHRMMACAFFCSGPNAHPMLTQPSPKPQNTLTKPHQLSPNPQQPSPNPLWIHLGTCWVDCFIAL